MTDQSHRRDDDTPDPGADAPEASLAARISRSSADAGNGGTDGGVAETLARPAAGPDEGAGQPLSEGPSGARSLDRIDAADATFGESQPMPGSIAAVEGASGLGDVEGDAPGDALEDPSTTRDRP